MKINKSSILVINGGSSSIKFALYEVQESLPLLLSGQIENIGSIHISFHYHKYENNPVKESSLKKSSLTENSLPESSLTESSLKLDSIPRNTLTENSKPENLIPEDSITRSAGQKNEIIISAKGFDSAIIWLVEWLESRIDFANLQSIGHRVVYGMEHTEPQIISDELINSLSRICDYDPDHMPEEIKLIQAFQKRYPNLKQIACFDTSFHTKMPRVAKLLTIPLKFNRKGIYRFGFHGISYTYLMEKLIQLEVNPNLRKKVVLLHLGSGASLAAVKEGISIDTSMGFSPSSGIPMGTRTGDLDPGIVWYLIKTEKLDLNQFNNLINHESGLLGISETSADMQELINIQDTDPRAKEAIELFCYQAKKWIGSFSAAMHGIDTLVFSGGIGENSSQVREKICEGLEFLGVELDKETNIQNHQVISKGNSKVKIYVINTKEEWMIARSVNKILGTNTNQ